MNLARRLIKGDRTRKTRFHTSNGHLCLKPHEFLRAFGTTLNKIAFGKYSRTPWLVFSAVDYLAENISGRRVFEFGSGMSTVWFAERCAQVVSVESNSGWYEAIRERSLQLPNVKIIYASSKEDYLDALAAAGDKFDLILVDGLYRSECARLARQYLNRGGLIVVDNTDKFPDLAAKVKELFSDSDIRFFRGWTPGNLHPSETSVIERIPV
ncbi:MAG: class I SAM-dependent methyltransferase [Candidatus Sulfotelmatobacter sp.]